MGVLTQRFFLWYKSNANIIVLLYAISSAVLTINALFTIAFVIEILQFSPTDIRQHTGFTPFNTFLSGVQPGSFADVVSHLYLVSSIVSFMATWSATALLLRHYSKRLGNAKYWILVSIPLAYFISQFISLVLSVFLPLLKSEPVHYGILFTLIFTLSKPAGGILFGIAFWSITRNIDKNSILRYYMILSGIGFILLYTSNQAIILLSIPYPPFGLATVTFVGLSSYLILVGIYSSAVSVSGDVKLRKSIREFTIKESKLLDSIGFAQMVKETEKRALHMTEQFKAEMLAQSGIEPSVNEDEIKEYIEEALKEVHKSK